MEVIIAPPRTKQGAGRRRLEKVLRRQPEAVLGGATGSSPLIIYDELADEWRRYLVAAKVRAFISMNMSGCRKTSAALPELIQLSSRQGRYRSGSVLDGRAGETPDDCAA